MALHIGTCSWKYDSWEGIVYPKQKNYNYLEEYAKHFDTVEVDQWFWSLFGVDKVKLPEPEVVREYVNSVPETFTFGVKVPNSITLTHFYPHNRSRFEPMEKNPYFFSIDLFNQFLETMEPLGKQIELMMFEFEYLNLQKMKSQKEFLTRFEEFIKPCSHRYRYAVETRNPNYLNEKYFEFLNRNGLYHVFVQGYYMPPIKAIYDRYSRFIKDRVAIRLMGPDRAAIEKKTRKRWDSIMDPKDAELEEIIQIIRDLEEREIDIFLYINNHYEGSAPLTIEKIKRRLRYP
ncbi:MAG: DUF72 domain-containing protein [Candidatus Omnitrophota bacterium]